MNLEFGLRFNESWDSCYELGMTQGYQLDHLLSLKILKPFCDNVLLEHDGLPHVLPLAVNLDFWC